MIARLKNATARDWITRLERDGFALRRGKGSHHVYEHPDGRRVLVVYHNLNDRFGPKTIKQLLSGTGWEEEELSRFGLI
jgi:predicted RNA binding protein YcfA (HicA-like mRNA interferase family)